MKSVDYQEWKKRRQSKSATAVRVENSLDGQRSGGRPRDPEKERELIRLEKARRQRLIESGKLRIISPRIREWHIDLPD